jgi:hypothetical protein
MMTGDEYRQHIEVLGMTQNGAARFLGIDAHIRRSAYPRGNMTPIGARFEIAIDGTPRTYRDRKELAIEAATVLKTKNVHAEVTVRDLETGKTITVKHPLQK